MDRTADAAASGLRGWKIGLIGTGRMGAPMARNLHRAGAEMHLYSRSPGKIAPLTAEGMRGEDSPAALTRAVGPGGVIIAVVTDTPGVENILYREDGILSAMREGQYFIDMGTTSAIETARFARDVAARGGHYMDAPVSGGEIGARKGDLSVMAGAEDTVFRHLLPILHVLGGNITHMGGIGTGQIAKAANQAIVGMTIDAVAEAIALAKAGGIEPARLRQALMGGFATSRILDLHGQRIADGDFTPGAQATIQRKDIAQALELARHLKLDLPGLSANLALWDKLIEKGDGGLDHSALFRLFDPDEGSE